MKFHPLKMSEYGNLHRNNYALMKCKKMLKSFKQSLCTFCNLKIIHFGHSVFSSIINIVNFNVQGNVSYLSIILNH